ncbi:DUF305 domain-containing protein [Actinomadura sp. ATCC 31491]|uniref:DUF305 domain-containing protein n=1 Tax=Actinomadura luzonensis TaxID=2805427 RepID=A0ABT0FXN0_9ACTN|nr:DUF305 domain-containing protein [Actinomadura luzonensis]MCK2217100.1 DUF305 domain-containing protein [Actinomadura luzonensis]
MSIALATGALALAGVSACGGGDATTAHEGTRGSAPATTTTAAAQPAETFDDADVMFAQMMIPHHEQAVEMAGLAPERAGDPEIKDLAAQIKAAQDPEIQTMKGWLAAWGRPTTAGHLGHDMPGLMSEEDMTELRSATGTAFDKLFARQMIAHHEGAIEMARTEQAGGSDPRAKELARAIERTQQAEVERLRDLLDRL